jgi:hypothetical protein
MPTHFKIDHIVIMVEELAGAMADYASLGFTVLEGGVHADSPTHNALVILADGVYLEIIALRPGATMPGSSRVQKWVERSPGLVDMALLPGDIEADIAAARRRGLEIEAAQPGGRLRPDGQRIAWKTANLGPGLPFFCADVTPRSLRVPEGEARQHPNGVIGAREVVIAVTSLAASIDQYRALLGVEPQVGRLQAAPDAETASFALDNAFITLAQPSDPGSPLHAYLAQGGQRPYSFTLRTVNPTAQGDLDLSLTHGAHITLAYEDPG